MFQLTFLPEFSEFSVENSRFGKSAISGFPENVSRKFQYHLSPFRNFWSNVKRSAHSNQSNLSKPELGWDNP